MIIATSKYISYIYNRTLGTSLEGKPNVRGVSHAARAVDIPIVSHIDYTHTHVYIDTDIDIATCRYIYLNPYIYPLYKVVSHIDYIHIHV